MPAGHSVFVAPRERVLELGLAELRVRALVAELDLAVTHAECEAGSKLAAETTQRLAVARRQERELRIELETLCTDGGAFVLVGNLVGETCEVVRRRAT